MMVTPTRGCSFLLSPGNNLLLFTPGNLQPQYNAQTQNIFIPFKYFWLRSEGSRVSIISMMPRITMFEADRRWHRR